MAKTSSVFVCQNCEFQSPKWVGQCPNCGAWNTFVETLVVQSKTVFGMREAQLPQGKSISLDQVRNIERGFARLSSGIGEFDRVMGGGIVFGSVNLIGGEPGIGKSTLLTHIVLNMLNDKGKDYDVMYVCGEESPEQIGLRIARMNGKHLPAAIAKRLTFVTSVDVDECISAIHAAKPSIVIVDSIQSMQTSDLTGTAGSVGQLKECTQRLTRAAKSLNVPIFLVGHVTKDGAIAGPKVLEHIVDTVLELTGERTGFFRLLRSVKNRFGATDEVGVFQAVETGLAEVKNPSAVFLEESQGGVPGSAIVPVMEGTRPVLVEIQALVVESQLAMPRRVGRGIALPRIQLIAAVLQKHCGLPLGTQDIFVNVAGGFVVNEPGADLAIAMAIASSCRNIPLPKNTVYVGEIGLLGEVRTVGMIEKRAKEARRLGFAHVVTGKDARRIRVLVNALR